MEELSTDRMKKVKGKLSVQGMTREIGEINCR